MTEDKKLDRRVRRTRRQLRDALIELVMAKGYDAITIHDITEHADLSRATFYLHYRDKDELLVSTLESMFDELVLMMEQTLIDDPDLLYSEGPSLFAFHHVQEYSDLYKALLGEKGVAYVIYREMHYLASVAERQLTSYFEGREPPPVPIPILAQHLGGSLFTMILWWLENDLPYSPEYMANTYRQLAIPGVLNSIGAPLNLKEFKPDAD